MIQPDEMRKRVGIFLEAMSTGNLDLYRSVVAEGCKVWTSGHAWFAGDHTVEDLLSLTAEAHQLFPSGIQFTILNTIAEGDQIAVEAISSGAHVGGETYRNTYFFLFRFTDGRISMYKEYMDTEIAIRFLGKDRPLTADA